MALFGDSKGEDIAAAPPGIPTDKVINMRNQGMSNNQIVQALQRDGYKTHQIFDAMNQADMRPASPIPEEQNQMMDAAPQMSTAMQEPTPQDEPAQPAFSQPEPEPQPEFDLGAQETAPPSLDDFTRQVEEISEAIIDEKWDELIKNVNKVLDWKNAMEVRMNTLEQRFEDLRRNFEVLQKGILEKVEDYDASINNVGTNIKAMEQVFKQVLPNLTQNVNELGRITKGMKQKKEN